MNDIINKTVEFTFGNVILTECKRLNSLIQPISDRYHGPLDLSKSQNTLFPFVLLLGNHSSGKSSFINFLLQRKVQATGVAPTDDNFTIIGPGEEDIDRNGPALVGDPDLGFSDLTAFGSTLVNHTQLKVRAGTAVKDFMVVDSPGMIDSPSPLPSDLNPTPQVDRGYDFQAVCRWYAERADVVLLFFDPDKPGTTGETLSILTSSLVGLDHKVNIILNKADQFHKIHDFARAYGSLCWNLSKVIPRKDLPPIHTMCVPVPPLPGGEDGREDAPRSFMEQGVLDLVEARNEVTREVRNAPRRRVDHDLSSLSERCVSLLAHLEVLERVTASYQQRLWRARWATLGCVVVTGGLTWGVHKLFPPSPSSPSAPAPASSSSHPSSASFWSEIGGRMGGFYERHRLPLLSFSLSSLVSLSLSSLEYLSLHSFLSSFSSRAAFEQIFDQVRGREVGREVRGRVVGGLVKNLPPSLLAQTPRVLKTDLLAVQRILKEDLVNLRRRASPTFPLLSPPLKAPGGEGLGGREGGSSLPSLSREGSGGSLYLMAEEVIAQRRESSAGEGEAGAEVGEIVTESVENKIPNNSTNNTSDSDKHNGDTDTNSENASNSGNSADDDTAKC